MAIFRLFIFLALTALLIWLAYSYLRGKGAAPELKVPSIPTRPGQAHSVLPSKEALRLLMALKTEKKGTVKKALARYAEAQQELKLVVPETIQQRLAGIEFSARDVEPKLTNGIIDGDRFFVFFALTDYIPRILNIYLDLPAKEKVAGSEATTLVATQLATISDTISNIQEAETAKSLRDLKAHASFLEDKLRDFK